jgi:hypothetical protein
MASPVELSQNLRTFYASTNVFILQMKKGSMEKRKGVWRKERGILSPLPHFRSRVVASSLPVPSIGGLIDLIKS